MTVITLLCERCEHCPEDCPCIVEPTALRRAERQVARRHRDVARLAAVSRRFGPHRPVLPSERAAEGRTPIASLFLVAPKAWSTVLDAISAKQGRRTS